MAYGTNLKNCRAVAVVDAASCSHALAARTRDRGGDMRKVRRLVSAGGRLRLQVSRQKIGTIGLDHQLVGGNPAHERQQVSAAPLVADPAGDADAEAHAEVVVQLVRLTREAMSDPACRQCARVLSQNRDKVFVRVALMQEHRLAHACRDLELPRKRVPLHVTWREVAEVIETAFAYGYDFRPMREPFELVHQLAGELRGMMRMNASGCVQDSGMRVCQRDGLSRAFRACTGNDHLRDSCGRGTGHYSVPVAVITIVGEVDSDIDQCG